MKDYLINICKKYGYVDPPNKSGITIDLIIEGIIDRTNITQFLRNHTGCAKETTTRALKRAFPDRDPIRDRDLRKFLLAKESKRYCPTCNHIKDICEFYTNISKPDGVATSCKECSKQSRIDTYNKDPQKEIIANNTRKLSKEYRTPSWANTEEIARFYRNRPEGYHVDHIIPLHGKLVSGLHIETNLQYLLANENLSKSNKF